MARVLLQPPVSRAFRLLCFLPTPASCACRYLWLLRRIFNKLLSGWIYAASSSAFFFTIGVRHSRFGQYWRTAGTSETAIFLSPQPTNTTRPTPAAAVSGQGSLHAVFAFSRSPVFSFSGSRRSVAGWCGCRWCAMRILSSAPPGSSNEPLKSRHGVECSTTATFMSWR